MMLSKLEVQIDAELAELGVRAHITHLKQPDGYHSVITVATPKQEKYRDLDIALATIYLEAHTMKRSDLGQLIIDRFADLGCGAAPCHHRDKFSRSGGRIRSKGRLLKLQKQEVLAQAGVIE